MSLEANKALADRLAGAISRQDLKALETLMAPEAAAPLAAELAELFAAFPDLHGGDVEQVAEGDTVASRWVFLGTHRGAYRGVEATGKTIAFRGISLARLEGGRVVSLYRLTDELDLARQLASEMPQEMLESVQAAVGFTLRGLKKTLN